MRSVLTVSLPKEGVHTIREKAEERGFANVSEYVRFLVALDADEDRITRDEFLVIAQRAQRDYVVGKLRPSRSLRDLLPRA